MLVLLKLVCYNLSQRCKIRFEDFIMRKIRYKNKMWLDKHSVKALHYCSKRKNFHKNIGILEYERNINRHRANTPNEHSHNFGKTNIIFTAPMVFSIQNNPEETIDFFNRFLAKYREHKINTKFYIDSSKVEFVSVDALMYLLAIISNGKYQSIYKYGFSGNFPKNLDARKTYIDSGFLNFVSSKEKGKKLNYLTDKISILQGKLVEPDTAAQVCKFVQQKCSCGNMQTQPIYEIFIELMGNTKQHAYEETKSGVKMPACWFLFAEEKEETIDFVFLDTGLGIPTTVNRKFAERFISSDSVLLKSALNGEYRSQTKKSFRGKGLPQISKCFSSDMFDNVFIYSESGCCKMNKCTNGDYQTTEFKNKVLGTLFCWQIIKAKVKL